MKSVVFLSLVIFFSVLPKYSQQTFWRKPTLPSDPNANVYQSKLIDNFHSSFLLLWNFDCHSLPVECSASVSSYPSQSERGFYCMWETMATESHIQSITFSSSRTAKHPFSTKDRTKDFGQFHRLSSRKSRQKINY